MLNRLKTIGAVIGGIAMAVLSIIIFILRPEETEEPDFDTTELEKEKDDIKEQLDIVEKTISDAEEELEKGNPEKITEVDDAIEYLKGVIDEKK